MVITFVKHNAPIIIGDYQFADKVKNEVLSLLKNGAPAISQDKTNVKASLHTIWDWEPKNITFNNLKNYIRAEIERYFRPGAVVDGERTSLVLDNFWANLYKKGDYAGAHDHTPSVYSFAYYVKTKWYHPSLVFTQSGKRIRPKEGRFVAFPAYLKHHVPKNRYNHQRITLSGNLKIDRT